MIENIVAIIAVPSDTHTGSTVGLVPATWETFDGRVVTHNPIQTIIYQQWQECWQRVAELRLASVTWPRLIVVHAGDAIDGDHHATSELVTARIDEQERMHVALLQDALTDAGFDPDLGDELHYIAGTDVHAGEGAASEERIVRALLGDNASGGTRVHRVLYRRIHDILFRFTHHGPSVGSKFYNRSNPLRNHLVSEYANWLERGESIPRYYLSGHRHQFAHATVENQFGQVVTDGFILPSFCFKGDYAQMVAPDSRPNIGMFICTVYDDGSTRWECPMLTTMQEMIIEDGGDHENW